MDELCSVYNAELNQILDRLVPHCSPSVKRRPADPWFDAECRQAKRITRRLERAFSAANRRLSAASPATSGHPVVVAAVAAANAAWYSQRRDYRALRRRKCQDFWLQRVDACHSNPRQLWHTVDLMLGRCKQRPCDQIDADSSTHSSTTRSPVFVILPPTLRRRPSPMFHLVLVYQRSLRSPLKTSPRSSVTCPTRRQLPTPSLRRC